MGWIVPGFVKVCKAEKITKSLQYTVYFLQDHPGFTSFQIYSRPVLDSQKHLRRVTARYSWRINLACTREKDRHAAHLLQRGNKGQSSTEQLKAFLLLRSPDLSNCSNLTPTFKNPENSYLWVLAKPGMLMLVLKRNQIETQYLLCAAPGEQCSSAPTAPYRAQNHIPFCAKRMIS